MTAFLRSRGITRRGLLGASAGVGGALLLGRAGGPALGPARVDAQSAPSGEVRFPIWFGQADIEAWKQVIERFKAVAPEIEVKFEPLQWQQYWQKLNTQLAAGDAPTACGMHVGLVYAYADKGQLTELGALVQRDGFPIENLFPNLVEEGHWPKTGGAGLYMLPWRFVGSAFYVNKTLLDKKGIPMPTDGWTWDDWLEIAKATRDEGAGVYGSGLPSAQLQQAQFGQAGAYGPLDETLTKSNFLDPGIQEAVQFIADLALTHKVAPKPQDVPQVTGGVPQDLFLAGKLVLHPSATWNIPAYRDVEFEWDVVPQPQHKAKGAYAGPDGIAIPKESDNAEAAWAFIKFATSDPAAQSILGATGIPVTKDYALSEEYISGEAGKKPASYEMLVNELLALGRGYGFNSSWFEWTRESNQIFDQIYNGKTSIPDGLKAIDDKVTEILNRPA
jgi:multiple sugar transport system substrate-binding protein